MVKVSHYASMNNLVTESIIFRADGGTVVFASVIKFISKSLQGIAMTFH